MTNFKQTRLKLNLTAKQIAPLLGYSPRTVEAWDSGRKEPPRSALIILELREALSKIDSDIAREALK